MLPSQSGKIMGRTTPCTLWLSYLRKILIHGARAAVLRIKRDRAPIGAWLDALDARAPKNVVVVAMANKLARIAWAVLSSGNQYRPVAA
jgi:transposase